MQQVAFTRKQKGPAPLSELATHATDLQLAARYGVNRSTVWRWTQHGKFPQPVKLSAGCTRWKLAEVEAWERSRGEGGQQ